MSHYPGSNGKHSRGEVLRSESGKVCKVHTEEGLRCPHCDQVQVGGVILVQGSWKCEHCGSDFLYLELWSPDHTLWYKSYYLP